MEENRSWLVLFMQTMRTRREGCYGGLSNLGMKESTDLRSGAGQICASRLNSEVKWNLISGFASIMFLRTQDDSARNTSLPSWSVAMRSDLNRQNLSMSCLLSAVIQQALWISMVSNRQRAPYSCSRRYWSTSNWSTPTVPTILRFPCSWVKSWATPSSVSCSMPLESCLDLEGSRFTSILNTSGEKQGMPWNMTFSPSVRVSPILKFPVS